MAVGQRPGPAPASGGETSISPARLVATLVVAVVGFAVQQTSIVPAVQTVQQSLGSSSEWSAWLVTVYLIVATVATPAMGRLGDLYGRRRLLIIGLAIFVVGSVAAAFAPNMATLILCRAVQGVGGAVYPLCLAIARAILPPERVTGAIAMLTGGFGVGTALGFVGGGLLAEYASWRWIFGTGAIIVAAGTALVARALPDTGGRATGGFDRVGTAVLAVAVVGLLTALTLVVPLGWGSPVTVGLLVVAAVAALSWIRIESRRADPLVDVHVLREPVVLVANLATVGLGWALFGSYLLIPRFAETPPGRAGFGLGAGAAVVGLVLLPLAVGQTVAGSGAGRLSARLGARTVFASGLTLVTAALGLLTLVRRDAYTVALLALLLGVGAGLSLEASSDVATQGVAGDVAAVSSAVNSTVRRLAGGIGGQVGTILLASLVLGSTTTPSRSAFVVSYLIAAAISLAGAALIVARAAPTRRRRTG